MSKFFITGTDTGIGKTLVSAILMRGLRAAYWKPIQSGIEEITDTQWMLEKTTLPNHHFLPESYVLSRPLSPHASAKIDNVSIELDKILLPQTANQFDHLIVEGAGGLYVPLNEKEYMIDLIQKLNIPVILVVRSGLGTINHSLLSIKTLQQHHIPIAGIVMNGELNKSNKEAIEFYGKVKVIAELEMIEEEITDQLLEKMFERKFSNKLN